MRQRVTEVGAYLNNTLKHYDILSFCSLVSSFEEIVVPDSTRVAVAVLSNRILLGVFFFFEFTVVFIFREQAAHDYLYHAMYIVLYIY